MEIDEEEVEFEEAYKKVFGEDMRPKESPNAKWRRENSRKGSSEDVSENVTSSVKQSCSFVRSIDSSISYQRRSLKLKQFNHQTLEDGSIEKTSILTENKDEAFVEPQEDVSRNLEDEDVFNLKLKNLPTDAEMKDPTLLATTSTEDVEMQDDFGLSDEIVNPPFEKSPRKVLSTEQAKEIDHGEQIEQVLTEFVRNGNGFPIPSRNNPMEVDYTDPENVKLPGTWEQRRRFFLPWTETVDTKRFCPVLSIANDRDDKLYSATPQPFLAIEAALKAYLQVGGSSVEALETTIFECRRTPLEDRRPLEGLRAFLKMDEEKQDIFFELTRFIANLALNAKRILPAEIMILRRHSRCSATFTQKQCACILAHMFFCGMTRNFFRFYDSTEPVMREKIKFILNYFEQIQKKMPQGKVTFKRRRAERVELRKVKINERLISSIKLLLKPEGTIEDVPYSSQVDFANCRIGGGVLSRGAVQEELMFLASPELMISLHLCEELQPLESISIVGAQRFSEYQGYARNVKFTKSYDEREHLVSTDSIGRFNQEIVAIDAVDFSDLKKDAQYRDEWMEREINKLFAGFVYHKTGNLPRPPVTTGWWGCGVFGGDKQLKALLQITAAVMTERDLVFCLFGEKQLGRSLLNIFEMLSVKNATIGDLMKCLCEYKEQKEVFNCSVFDHVSQYFGRGNFRN